MADCFTNFSLLVPLPDEAAQKYALDPAWTRAQERPPMTAGETRAFMKRLATYVFEHHMKRDDSPQRGMVYEYFWA